jgi:hypothetical protein
MTKLRLIRSAAVCHTPDTQPRRTVALVCGGLERGGKL